MEKNEQLCFIIGDSRTKYLDRYLQPSKFKVIVRSISGFRIKEVDKLELRGIEEARHVALHVGTNNVPNNVTPATIVLQMEELILKVTQRNRAALMYISSILPRAVSKFPESKMSPSLIEAHNEKAEVLNDLFHDLAARYEHFFLSEMTTISSLEDKLLAHLENFNFKSGILHEVFEKMAFKVNAMSAQEKDCVLLCDEMPIAQKEEYDVSSRNFVGDVTLPGYGGSAAHALTFMLGGINTRWKQTVAYFTGNSTDGNVIKNIITDIAQEAENICLEVH